MTKSKMTFANLPPCGGCESKFTKANPPTDIGLFFKRDFGIGATFLCRNCRDKWFNCGAFTLNLGEADNYINTETES